MNTVVFAGQGSQFRGMGQELFKRYPKECKIASEVLGYDIESLCTEDTNGHLNKTQYTQPALYVVNALLWLDRRSQLEPVDCLMGHSLGEYNALQAAGAFDFATGLRLVKERGRLMAAASGGGMLAVLGQNAEQLGALLDRYGLSEIAIANYNTATQLVLSGSKKQIDRAFKQFEKADIQAVPLNVSGAFHSSHMQEAATAFEQFLKDVSFQPLQIPVIANTTARPYDDDQVGALLARQMASAVRWNDSVRYVMGQGKTLTVTELTDSPNPVLTSMIESIRANESPISEPRVDPSLIKVEAATTNGNVAAKRAQKSSAQAGKAAASASKSKAIKTTAGKGASKKTTAAKSRTGKLAPGTGAAKGKKRATASGSHTATEIRPEQLGAASFRQRYGLRYAYLAGAMYKGIGSKDLVIAMGKVGLLGFLGTAGMTLEQIETDLQTIQQSLNDQQPYGLNLLCHLDDPQMEMDTVALYLHLGVTCVEASAFMNITKALVHYRLSGLERAADGSIHCHHRIIAKVSRPEVAQAFLSPAPARLVQQLLDDGLVTAAQAEMGQQVAMSFDLCVEADSGGHTDQGVSTVLLPTMQRLRQQIEQEHAYDQPIHIGLAGGIGAPESAAAAFMMGADFILTGSINQCTVEGGTSDAVKDLLQAINVQDTDYAPAGDMFELGAKVQVLKKGVFFAARANKLWQLYNHYERWEDIPQKTQQQLEKRYFQKTFDEVWAEVKQYRERKSQQKMLAEADPKRKMAQVFRWYFAYSNRLAFAGDRANQVDFQVHTGPALGAFNQWVKDTDLADWRQRHVDKIAERLMVATAEHVQQHISGWLAEASIA